MKYRCLGLQNIVLMILESEKLEGLIFLSTKCQISNPWRQQLLNTWCIWIRFHTWEILKDPTPVGSMGNGSMSAGAACQHWPTESDPQASLPSSLHDLACLHACPGYMAQKSCRLRTFLTGCSSGFLDFMRAPVIQHFFEWCSSWDMTATFQREDFHSAGWSGPRQLSFFLSG